MGIFQVEYPDSVTVALNMDCESFERDAKMAMAVKLYEMGRMTSGQAAMLAGKNSADFLLECPQFNVASVAWDNDELAAEFKELQ